MKPYHYSVTFPPPSSLLAFFVVAFRLSGAFVIRQAPAETSLSVSIAHVAAASWVPLIDEFLVSSFPMISRLLYEMTNSLSILRATVTVRYRNLNLIFDLSLQIRLHLIFLNVNGRPVQPAPALSGIVT